MRIRSIGHVALRAASAATHASDPSCALSADVDCVDAFTGATVLIVTNALPTGPGSLAQAIADANADAGPNIIGFNLSGACPRTIPLAMNPLPAITDSLSIRGYTQPGAGPNTNALADNATICMQIKVAAGYSIANGLRFAPTDVAATLDVSGLSIGGFDDGIRIEGGNYTIGGNFIGLAADGSTPATNAYNGVHVVASNAYFATTRLLGGSDPAQRNLISGNGTGVELASGGGTLVRNNFIGTDRSGNAAAGNVVGIYAASLGNDIGDNVISGNDGIAVRLETATGSANTVADNRIGVKAFAVCPLPPCAPDFAALGNGGAGVRIAGGSSGNYVSGNAIAWNDGDGISLPDAGRLNRLGANAMHDNAGLGIDLGTDGVDANDNDANAAANAPNRLLNYPLVDDAGGGDDGGRVRGHLQSTNGHYTIEFYADDLPDPTLHGEGRDYLGSGDVDIVNAPAGGNGSVAFDLPVSGTALVGKQISAIARDADGNTSEFGEGRAYVESDVIFADGFE
jgi:hypothetical protein